MNYEHQQERSEYRFINPGEIAAIASQDPLWFKHPSINRYLLHDTANKSDEWKEGAKEVLRLFTGLLANDQVALGTWPDGFNDGDRWIPEYYGKSSRVEKPYLDTVVVHHTVTDPNISYDELNALHLLRLYAPEFARDTFGKDQPVSSGHFLNGRQTFLGYHYLVRRDGSFTQPLRREYTGFHAGDYGVNCRSIGIAIVDDLTEREPTIAALNTTARLARSYSPEILIGHGEVIGPNGKRVDTECPGRTFPRWRDALLAKAA